MRAIRDPPPLSIVDLAASVCEIHLNHPPANSVVAVVVGGGGGGGGGDGGFAEGDVEGVSAGPGDGEAGEGGFEAVVERVDDRIGDPRRERDERFAGIGDDGGHLERIRV